MGGADRRMSRRHQRNGPKVKAAALPDAYLCNTYLHLIMALADITAHDRPATVIYLDDEVSVPHALQTRLVAVCPAVTFIYTSDDAAQAAFTRLPRWIPAIIRRNLSWHHGHPVRPRDWRIAALKGHRFTTGYLGHDGFFMSKVLAGICDRIVLRESGLNIYTTQPVPPLKAILRAACGLPPFRQTWGEARWVTQIEASRPQDLPATVQAKAVQHGFSHVMEALPPARAAALVSAFVDEPLQSPTPGQRSALLLSQPLGLIGVGEVAQGRLYAGLARKLQQAGYRVTLKLHPRDRPFDLPGCITLPQKFPIEAWRYCNGAPFDLAVAIRSAALDGETCGLTRRAVQLVQSEEFVAHRQAFWHNTLPDRLAALLSVSAESAP